MYPGAVGPFSVFEPEAGECPLIVEVPHAGLYVDPETLATLAASGQAMGRDADLYVDQLYADAPALGATLLVAHASRYVCDLNRGRAEVDALTVRGGAGRANPHGLIWRSTTDGTAALVDGPLPYSELERRLHDFYDPYHAALKGLIERKRARFGYAILLCAHSMPSVGKSSRAGVTSVRADVVPGTRQRTTASAAVIRTTERLAQARGLSLAHDNPYSGGFSTGHYGRPRHGVHAIQVELSRRLYMNETALSKTSGFDETRQLCRELVAALAEVTP